MKTQTEQTTPENKAKKLPPYSCMGSPPTGNNGNSNEKRTPIDVAKEFHERHISTAVTDMRGQL